MKKIGINGSTNSPLSSCAVMSGVCLVLVLSGCISIHNSPAPRFYVLQAVSDNQVSKK